MVDVFLSRPTSIDASFLDGLAQFMERLEDLGLRPHTLGISDYPTKAPLDEVIRLLDRCRGAVILGYPQIEVSRGLLKGNPITNPFLLPTEWNHIEAGLAYARGLPLLVIHHKNVTRGIFDRGAIGSFIYELDLTQELWALSPPINGALRRWLDECLVHDEEERKSMEEAEEAAWKRGEAAVTVRLERLDGWAGRGMHHRIVISNYGPAEARDVNLTFPDGKDPIPKNERQNKLPVSSLPEGSEYELIAALGFDCGPPFRAKLEWADQLGAHEREYPLT